MSMPIWNRLYVKTLIYNESIKNTDLKYSDKKYKNTIIDKTTC